MTIQQKLKESTSEITKGGGGCSLISHECGPFILESIFLFLQLVEVFVVFVNDFFVTEMKIESFEKVFLST